MSSIVSLKFPDPLRSEDEILANWKEDITSPLVSVRCITYNHATYIEDAIKGFLIQETDFPFEVWIHDDASVDGTREIIERYQKYYPRIIKTILQDVNQYSKGNKPSQFLNSVCCGEYYALCEGDDNWTAPDKLAKQVVAMENHPNIDLCFHSAVKENMESGQCTVIGQYRIGDGFVPAEHIIERAFGQIPTASTLVRSSVYEDMNNFKEKAKKLIVGDIYLHIMGAKRGSAYFLDSTMSHYRYLVPGSYSLRIKEIDGNQAIEKAKISINAYKIANEMTEKKYELSFKKRITITVKKAVKSYANFTARSVLLINNARYLTPKDVFLCCLLAAIPRKLFFVMRDLKKRNIN
mgnify:CR=1 FL=1